MADVVDRIVSDLIVQGIDRYVANFETASKAVDGHIAALRRLAAASKLADEMLASRSARGVPGSAEAKEANAAAAAVKRAAKEKADAEKAAAREAAAAEKAAEREKAAAVRLTAKEQATAAREAEKAAAQRAAAEKRASDAVIAAAEKEAAARARLAEIAAARIAKADASSAARQYGNLGTIERGTGAILGRSYTPESTGQRSIPAAVINGTPAAPVAREIDHARADAFDLSAKARVASVADRQILQDELDYIRRINAYKAAGLTETEAQARAEGEVALIEQQRVRIAAEQQIALERQLAAQSKQAGKKISLLGPALIGGFGLAELSHLNDKYIELTNSLKVAGVSAANLDGVQNHLLTTATRTGQSINSLGDTYRSIALASHDLGASQEDALKITDAVANSLKITGASGNNARAAILQLGHAFETGRVNAREFNGLALNAYPLLKAAASASVEYGGSVAKLREAIIAGEVSSRKLFELLAKGSEALKTQAAGAVLTTAQGFAALNSALIVYFGQADKAQGLSAAFGRTLQVLADNLNTVIPAIAAVGYALSVGYVQRAAAAAIATNGLRGALLSAFGGPVGLAVAGVTLALASFVVESNNSAAAAKQAEDRLTALREEFGTAGKAGHVAASGIARVGTDALGAIPHVNAFAGAVGNLADQLYRQARAARVAQIEGLQKRLSDGQANEAELGAKTAGGRAVARGQAAEGLKRGDIAGYISTLLSQGRTSVDNVLSGGRISRDDQRAYERQVAGNREIQAQISQLKRTPITPDDLPGGVPSNILPGSQKQYNKLKKDTEGLEKLAETASGDRLDRIKRKITINNAKLRDIEAGVSVGAASAAEGGGGRGRRGPSAETLARRAEAERKKGVRDQAAFDAALREAETGYLSDEADLTNDAAKRAEAERQRVRFARDQKAKEIASNGPGKDGTGKYSVDEVKRLQGLNAADAEANLDKIDLAERRRLADEAASIDKADLEANRARLQDQLGLAETTSQRRRISTQLLNVEFALREREARAVLAPESRASAAEKEIATRQLARLPGDRIFAQEQNDAQNAGPFASYRRQLRGLVGDNEAIRSSYEQVAVNGIGKVEEQLSSTIGKVLGLKGAFGELATSIITDLARVQIERVLLGALDRSGSGGGFLSGLFGGGKSSSTTTVSSLVEGDETTRALSGIFGGLPGGGFGGFRAAGGSVVGGSTYLVGERGPELFTAPRSGVIAPNNAPVNVGGGGGGQITVHVEANDYFDARVAHVSGPIAQRTSVQVVKAAAPQIVGRAVDAAPARVAQERVLRG